MSELETIISKLKNKPEVEAVFITGSVGVGHDEEYSDIDLVIVLNKESELKSMFQWVDAKPCDIYLFDIDSVSQILNKDSISPNDREGLIVGFLEKADIKFDRSGKIQKFKQGLEKIKNKLKVPESKKKWFEGIINSAYIVNSRYFRSDKKEYFEALEVKLLKDLDMIFKGYFEFRNIPWRGEKQALEYLKNNDKTFYNLFILCIQSVSIKDKYDDYSKLVNRVFGNSGFGVWQNDTVQTFLGPNENDKAYEDQVNHWKSLIG